MEADQQRKLAELFDQLEQIRFTLHRIPRLGNSWRTLPV